MTIASRTFAMTLVLLAIACGDDEEAVAPSDDGGTPVVDSGEPDAGHGDGHAHTLDAAVSDASVVVDAAPDPTCSATISLQDFLLVPANPTVTSGQVTLCARNDGRSLHDLAIRGADGQTLMKTASLNPGESGRFTLTLSAGAFPIYCSLPGHESLGMKGTLTAN